MNRPNCYAMYIIEVAIVQITKATPKMITNIPDNINNFFILFSFQTIFH